MALCKLYGLESHWLLDSEAPKLRQLVWEAGRSKNMNYCNMKYYSPFSLFSLCLSINITTVTLNYVCLSISIWVHLSAFLCLLRISPLFFLSLFLSFFISSVVFYFQCLHKSGHLSMPFTFAHLTTKKRKRKKIPIKR